ncbi:hypothetical protein Hdeb2414_s0010g00340591 [Helianthus debilis subsp. tardiflorus]
MIVAMFGRKRAKTSGEGSSSGAVSGPGYVQKRWEQLSNVEEGNGQLYRQDWAWEEFKNSRSASAWNDNKKKALSKYKNKKLEAKMWKWKMVTGVTTSVPERVVCERAVNVEEFHTIGITQRFEELGWERVLDWSPTWKLIGNIGKNQMIMSFEHMNAIARFDSFGVGAYDYYELDHFLDNKTITADLNPMLEAVLPGSGGLGESRNDLSLEGRILQGISLENVMVRFGDRGKVKALNCRVVMAANCDDEHLGHEGVVHKKDDPIRGAN